MGDLCSESIRREYTRTPEALTPDKYERLQGCDINQAAYQKLVDVLPDGVNPEERSELERLTSPQFVAELIGPDGNLLLTQREDWLLARMTRLADQRYDLKGLSPLFSDRLKLGLDGYKRDLAPAVKPLALMLKGYRYERAIRPEAYYDPRGIIDLLMEIGGEEAFSTLIEASKSPDNYTRDKAKGALQKMGDCRAFPESTADLNSPDISKKLKAAEALAPFRCEGVLPILTGTLDIPVTDWASEQNQLTAVRALGKFGGEEGMSALVGLWEKVKGKDNVPDWRDLRRGLKKVEGKVGACDGLGPSIAAQLAEAGDRRAVAILIERLERGCADGVSDEARLLGSLRVYEAVPALIRAMKATDESPNFTCHERSAIAGAFGMIGDNRAVPILIDALEHPDSCNYNSDSISYDVADELVSIASALGMIGDRQAVPALIKTLQNRYGGVQLSAVDALGRIGDSRATAALIGVMERGSYSSPHRSIRIAAAEALGRIGDEAAIPALAKFAAKTIREPYSSFEDEDTALQARRSLGKMCKGGCVSLPPWMKRDRRLAGAVFRTLGNGGDGRSVQYLARGLKAKDEHDRLYNATALGMTGDARATPALIALARHASSQYVRLKAIEAIGQVGDDRAIPFLMTATTSPDGKIRNRAINALGDIGDRRAIPVLIAKLKNRTERGSAIAALGRIAGPIRSLRERL